MKENLLGDDIASNSVESIQSLLQRAADLYQQSHFIACYEQCQLLLNFSLSSPQLGFLTDYLLKLMQTEALTTLSLESKKATLHKALQMARDRQSSLAQFALCNALADLLTNACFLEKNYEEPVEVLRLCQEALRIAYQTLTTAEISQQLLKLHRLEALFTYHLCHSFLLQESHRALQEDKNRFDIVFQAIKQLGKQLSACGEEELVKSLFTRLIEDWGQLKKKYSVARAVDEKQLLEILNQITQTKQTLQEPKIQSQGETYRSELILLRQNIFELLQQQKPIREIQITITQGFKELLTKMLQDAQTILGPAPCAFAFIGFGSYARQEMLPYSDLEFALLIEKPSEFADRYFKILLKLFHFKVESLDESDEKHLGFHLDEAVRPEKDTRLYGTPDKIANSLLDDKQFATEGCKVLAFSMLRATLIFGDTEIINQYNAAVIKHLHELHVIDEKIKKPFQQIIALQLLQYNLTELEKFWQDPIGNEFNIKNYSMYLTQVCSILGLYYAIKAKHSEDILNALAFEEIFDSNFIDFYKQVLANVNNLRLKIQKHYNEPEDFAVFLSAKHGNVQPKRNDYQLNDEEYLLLITAKYAVLQMISQTCQTLITAGQLPKAYNPWKLSVDNLFRIEESLDNKYLHLLDLLLISNTHKTTPKNLLDNSVKFPMSFFSTPPQSNNIQITPDHEEYLQKTKTIIDVLRTLVSRMLFEKNSIKQHHEIYEKVPEKLRIFYLKIMETFLNNPLENPLLASLYQHPNLDGWRPVMIRNKIQWSQTLKSLFQENVNAEELPNIDREKQLIVLTHNFSNQRKNHELKKYLLKAEVINQLLDQSGQFKHKPEKQAGRHTVLPVHCGKHRFWFKLLPEQPGIENLIHEVASRISKGGTPNVLLTKMIIHDKAYAVQISEHIYGENLDYTLRQTPERLHFLERRSLVNTFLRLLLTNPEDDKGDDYFLSPIQKETTTYELIRNDNERAYYQPDDKVHGLFTTSKVLQVKSILYCLDFMYEPLNVNEFDDFMKVYPHLFIESVLKKSKEIHAYFRNLFSDEEICQHFKLQVPGPSLLTLPIAQGWVKEALNRHSSIRKVIKFAQKNHRPITMMVLLKTVQPILANYYERAFLAYPIQQNNPQLALQRFDYVTEGLYEKTKLGHYISKIPNATAISQSLHLKQNLTMTDALAIANGHQLSPIQALQELADLNGTRLEEIREELLSGEKGSIEIFQRLTIRHQLVILQQIKNALQKDPLAYGKDAQKRVLKAIVKTPFHTLTLTPFKQVLTDELLEDILIKGANSYLLELDVSECDLLTGEFLNKLAKYCPNIKKLILKNIAKIAFVSLPTQIFASLELIDISDCKNLFSIGMQNVPQLKHFIAIHCEKLTTIKLGVNALELLDLRGCSHFTEDALCTLNDLDFNISNWFAIKLEGCHNIYHQKFREKYAFFVYCKINSCSEKLISLIDQELTNILHETNRTLQESEIQQIFIATFKAWLDERLLTIRNIIHTTEVDQQFFSVLGKAINKLGYIGYDWALSSCNRLISRSKNDENSNKEMLLILQETIELDANVSYTIGFSPMRNKLKNILQNQYSISDKLAVIHLLGNIKYQDEQITDILINLVRDGINIPIKIAAIAELLRQEGFAKSLQHKFVTFLEDIFNKKYDMLDMIISESEKTLIKLAAAEVLLKIYNKKQDRLFLINILLEASKSKINDIKKDAILKLGQLNKITLDEQKHLYAHFNHTDKAFKISAINAACSLAQQIPIAPNVLEILINACRDHHDEIAAAAAAKTIANIAQPDKYAVDLLLTAINDNDPNIKLTTIEALENIQYINKEIRHILVDENTINWDIKILIFADITATCCYALKSLLKLTADSNEAIRDKSEQVLIILHPIILDIVILLYKRIEKHNLEQQIKILSVLVPLNSLLIKIFQKIKMNDNLKKCHQIHTEVVAILCNIIRNKKTSKTLKSNVIALCQYCDQANESIINLLLEIISDINAKTVALCIAAINTLGELGHNNPSIVAALQNLLPSVQFTPVKAAIIISLHQLGRPFEINLRESILKVITSRKSVEENNPSTNTLTNSLPRRNESSSLPATTNAQSTTNVRSAVLTLSKQSKLFATTNMQTQSTASDINNPLSTEKNEKSIMRKT